MEFLCVFRTAWLCFLLFSVGAGFPVKRGSAGSGYSFGLGYGYPREGFGSAYTSRGTSSGSDTGLRDPLDGGIARMITDLMRLSPRQSTPHFPWTSDYVRLGSLENRLVYPSSHIVVSNSGYQRARDFRSDTKYTQDTLDHIPPPGSDPMSESGGQKQ